MVYYISTFSGKCGVNKETIRYYEREKLLPEPSRSTTGYRLYTEEDVKRVKSIKQLQDLGFSLNEIYKLLGVVDKDGTRCEGMFEFVSKKEKEIQKQIINLKRTENMLSELRQKCPDKKEMYACPIIDVLIEY